MAEELLNVMIKLGFFQLYRYWPRLGEGVLATVLRWTPSG